jgi:predicted phosphodiesterase
MKWSKKYLENNYKDKSIKEISFYLKRSYDSVDSKLNRIMLPGDYKTKEDIDFKKMQKEKLQENIDLIHRLRNMLTDVEPIKRNLIIKKKTGDTLIIHITDWHVGRTIKDEMDNIIYNEKIFKERIDILTNEMLALLDGYIKKGTPIKDVAIVSTGDILDGMGIFSTQESLSEMSPPFQVMLAVNIIRKLILSLTRRKLAVTFYGVKGNHGEIRFNGKQKDTAANWDMMLYLILQDWAVNTIKQKNIIIHYSGLDYINFEIQGWKYHARHIAPIQSETAAGKGKFLGWARKHKFDAFIYGHYHHFGIWDRSGIYVFRGGSIPGGDEFSESLAEESNPIQLMWGVSKKRPLTFSYAVDLGGI